MGQQKLFHFGHNRDVKISLNSAKKKVERHEYGIVYNFLGRASVLKELITTPYASKYKASVSAKKPHLDVPIQCFALTNT